MSGFRDDGLMEVVRNALPMTAVSCAAESVTGVGAYFELALELLELLLPPLVLEPADELDELHAARVTATMPAAAIAASMRARRLAGPPLMTMTCLSSSNWQD
jgi:hypothetical protein